MLPSVIDVHITATLQAELAEHFTALGNSPHWRAVAQLHMRICPGPLVNDGPLC